MILAHLRVFYCVHTRIAEPGMAFFDHNVFVHFSIFAAQFTGSPVFLDLFFVTSMFQKEGVLGTICDVSLGGAGAAVVE